MAPKKIISILKCAPKKICYIKAARSSTDVIPKKMAIDIQVNIQENRLWDAVAQKLV